MKFIFLHLIDLQLLIRYLMEEQSRITAPEGNAVIVELDSVRRIHGDVEQQQQYDKQQRNACFFTGRILC